jgi:hypothetical protein
MSKLSKRDTILLAVIGLVAVLGGMYWFYVKPAKADLTAKTQAAQESADRVTQLNAELAKLTSATKKPKGQEVPIADELRLAKAYPYSEDIPVLTLQLEELAKQTHVELGEATPTDGTDYAGVTGTPFTINVAGKFFDVQDFLYRLHNRVQVDGNGKLRVKGRLVAVTKADLQPGGGDSTDAASGTTADSKVTASITVVAFSRTASAAGAPAAGADPAAAAAPQPTAAPAAATSGGTN